MNEARIELVLEVIDISGEAALERFHDLLYRFEVEVRRAAVREAVRKMPRPMQPAGTDKVSIGGVMVDRGDLLAALTPKGGDRE